jgi:hypothetical protein
VSYIFLYFDIDSTSKLWLMVAGAEVDKGKEKFSLLFGFFNLFCCLSGPEISCKEPKQAQILPLNRKLSM